MEWRDAERTRAVATKGDEELRVTKGADGTWSYASRSNPQDRGDMVDFEAQRGARTAAKAREAVRPEREGADRQHGPLDRTPPQGQKPEQQSPEHTGPDGPGRDPTRRRRRGR